MSLFNITDNFIFDQTNAASVSISAFCQQPKINQLKYRIRGKWMYLIKNNICRHFSPHVSFSAQGSAWGDMF